MAGGIRILEIDLKKIVALSTLRQLGFLITSIGIRLCALTLFHIRVHALIKRALFITVGVVLHKNRGVQDKRLLN